MKFADVRTHLRKISTQLNYLILDFSQFPYSPLPSHVLQAWTEKIANRPAVKRGLEVEYKEIDA